MGRRLQSGFRRLLVAGAGLARSVRPWGYEPDEQLLIYPLADFG